MSGGAVPPGSLLLSTNMIIRSVFMHVCVCVYIYIHMEPGARASRRRDRWHNGSALQSISEISSCFFWPRPWHIEIRHRVKKASTINLFGFETLKFKIRRL